MSRYIPTYLRILVAERALFRCEYCRLFEIFSFYTFQIEHIISLKHSGKTIAKNLAYACPFCNVNIGSDIATVLEDTLQPIRIYNPRVDKWDDHFAIETSGLIIPKTDIESG